MKLNIFEYTFDEHDENGGLLLVHSVCFDFRVFAAVMKHQEAPGTTFKKHMAICPSLVERGRLSVTGDSVQSPHPLHK